MHREPEGTVTRPHPVRRIGTAVLLAGVLAAVAVALAVAVVPAVTGASTYTVLSASMEPTLGVGSIVVVRPRPADQIAVHDVITFLARDPATAASRVVTHRVIAVEPGPAFRTQGDANSDPDPTLVAAADVRGVEWYSLPWVGSLGGRLTSLPGLLVVGGVMVLVLAAHLLLPRHARPARQPARR